MDLNCNFIETYDDALSSYDCDTLISWFENSEDKGPGCMWVGKDLVVDESRKKCIQLGAPTFSDKNILSDIILKGLLPCIDKYLDTYPPLERLHGPLGVDDAFAFKRFDTEEDGYKTWHTEHGPDRNSSRVLVWQFYLNDALSGTDFKFYPEIKMNAKKGRCIMWPAAFTHTHRSTPNKGLKYIISGWISFYHDYESLHRS